MNWFYENRELHSLKLEALYELIQISRSGFYKYRAAKLLVTQKGNDVLKRVKELREEHPRMGARPLYIMMMNNADDEALLSKTGSNKFEELLLSHGMRVRKIRNFRRTTFSSGFYFDNLILDLIIKELDHVWVSDITYFYCPQIHNFFYLTSIIDVYSRRCLAITWSKTLQTEQTSLPALKIALKSRKRKKYEKLIFHSDGGGQYYDKEFVKLLRAYNITSSMGKCAYENPFAEKFNDILKNYYLIPWKTEGKSLPKAIKRFMVNYNSQKPHQNLGNLTPIAFEQHIQNLPLSQRTELLLKNPEKNKN